MITNKTLKELVAPPKADAKLKEVLKEEKKVRVGQKSMSELERLSLGSLILIETIIAGFNNTKKILANRLQEALNFEQYNRKPWGQYGYDFQRNVIQINTPKTREK